jgi:hypothetical protein
MFSKLKKFFTSSNVPDEVFLPAVVETPPMPKVKKPRAPRKKKEEPLFPVDKASTEKAAATLAGEPWVSVTGVEIDLDNVGNGSFNLDWNEIFVARLIKAGYRGENDIQIVDQWFTDLARNIVMETYQQEQADPDNRRNTK